MDQEVQAGLKLIAVMDGTSINGYLRVENTPLIQRYNDAGAFTPDFETLADNKKPAVVPILVNTATGALMTPQTLTWKYNGITLTFGSDGLSTNEGMEGVFKKDTAYSTNYDGSTKTVEALRVLKNLVPLSGYDNDRITISGTIEVGGNQIAFDGISTEVIIQKSTGATFDVVIADGILTQTTRQITLTATLWNEGSVVSDLGGYSFDWKIIDTDGSDEAFTNVSTSNTQKVVADDVNWQARVRCTVKKGSDVVATGFCTVTDYSDPVQVQFNVTGIEGLTVKQGQTATVTPVAKRRDSGTTVTVSSWEWRTMDNAGADFTLTGKSAATFTATSAQVSYSDMARAGYGMNIYVSADVNV